MRHDRITAALTRDLFSGCRFLEVEIDLDQIQARLSGKRVDRERLLAVQHAVGQPSHSEGAQLTEPEERRQVLRMLAKDFDQQVVRTLQVGTLVEQEHRLEHVVAGIQGIELAGPIEHLERLVAA